MDSALQAIAYKLADTLTELESKRGELAEVLKAEAQASNDGWSYSTATTDTGRRQNAKAMALPHYQERMDLECDVAVLTRWADFYTLLIQSNTPISVDGLPPRNQ